MQAPDDFVLKILDFAWAVVLALVGVVWKQQSRKIEEMQLAHDKDIREVSSEVTRQRDVSAKIFDRLEEHARRSEDRHMEVVRLIHEGLAHKVDKS